MPKVTMWYDPTQVALTQTEIEFIGSWVRNQVALMMSTAKVQLAVDDVDWIPIPLPAGSWMAAPINFEIEAIGYPERKKKLADKQEILVLKGMILESQHFGPLHIDPTIPLIWIKYVDPDGPHI